MQVLTVLLFLLATLVVVAYTTVVGSQMSRWSVPASRDQYKQMSP